MPPTTCAELLESGRHPLEILEQTVAEGDERQRSLWTGPAAPDLVQRAAVEITAWEKSGWMPVSMLDPEYPENLRGVHDRPPLIFVAGQLESADARAVALIGSRRATEAGLERARRLATELAEHGYTVISGLAAGIDTAAHRASLAAGGRTVAVIGTGLEHAYPPQNAALQRQIVARGAVISQFWPESGPSRESFPMRNATMSGVALATVIAEASVRSGARIQARLALAHGRPVFLAAELLDQPWAIALAARPGVSSFTASAEILDRLARLDNLRPLTA